MKRAFQAFCVTVLALEAFLAGQGADVTRVLTELRAALGADKPSAAKKREHRRTDDAVAVRTTRRAPATSRWRSSFPTST